jgi:uracil-DNA glycosylase
MCKDQSRPDLLFCVDEHNQPLPPQPRSLCHGHPGLTHRTVHVIVMDTRDRILVQKRSIKKDIQPGMWDTAVGGHVDPGEECDSAAIREFFEELGISPPNLTPLYDYLWISDMESERVRTYLCRCDGPFQFDPSEISDISFLSMDQLLEMDRENKITPNLRYELTRLSAYRSSREAIQSEYPIQQICRCRDCDRLVEYRESITPVKSFVSCLYWNNPVPGFGDLNARLLVIGLAPGAHGANRTGRPFTGDAAGTVLYKGLYDLGLSNCPDATSRGDGLALKDVFVTNAVKCVPPDNKPVASEVNKCRHYLEMELRSLPEIRSILTLGRQAFDTVRRMLQTVYGSKTRNWTFAHGANFHIEGEGIHLTACYHPSRRNINTGVLSRESFNAVLKAAYDRNEQ